MASTRKGRHVARFFLLTFAISWGLGGLCIVAFGQPGYVIGKSTTNPLFFLFFGFGPSFAAFIMAAATGGRSEVRELLARLTRWRVGFRWYAIVLFGIPALALCQMFVTALGGESAAASLGGLRSTFAGRWYYVVPYLFAALIGELLGGPLSEEPGWRGYALPAMLENQSPLSASVILGMVWGLWHLPLFFMPGVHQFHMSFMFFALNVIALSILITWVFIRTGGSVFMTVLMHLLLNLTALAAVVTWNDMVVVAAAAALVSAMGGLRTSTSVPTER